jgi:hypothetical protein
VGDTAPAKIKLWLTKSRTNIIFAKCVKMFRFLSLYGTVPKHSYFAKNRKKILKNIFAYQKTRKLKVREKSSKYENLQISLQKH